MKFNSKDELYHWYCFNREYKRRGADKIQRLPLSVETKNHPIHICVSGPSFNDTKDLITKIGGKVMGVNDGISHADMYPVMPEYYCLADPLYGDPKDELCDTDKRTVEILENYDKPLQLFMVDYLYNRMNRDNNNIAYIPVNDLDMPEHISQDKLIALAKANKAVPRFQTVSVMAIYVALQLGYKEIYIHGLDMSYLKTVYVDGKNDTYRNEPHYYGDPREGLCGYTYYEELKCITKSFESFYFLRDYADEIGAKIINMSEFSMVDCYEKYTGN